MGAKKSKKKAKRARPAVSRGTPDPLESATSSPTLVDDLSDSPTPEPESEEGGKDDHMEHKENHSSIENGANDENEPTAEPTSVRPSAPRQNSFARFTTFPERPNAPVTAYDYGEDDDVAVSAKFEPMEPEVEDTDIQQEHEEQDTKATEAVSEVQGNGRSLIDVSPLEEDKPEVEAMEEHVDTPLTAMEEMQHASEMQQELQQEGVSAAFEPMTQELEFEPMEGGTFEPMSQEEVEVPLEHVVQTASSPTASLNGDTNVYTPADPVADSSSPLTMMLPEPEAYENNTHQFSDYTRPEPTEDDIQSLNADLDTTVPSFFKKRNSSTSSRTSIPVVEVEEAEEPVESVPKADIPSPALSPTLEISLSPVSTPVRTPSPSKSPLRTPLHLSAAVRSMSPSSSNMEIRPFEKRFETRISSLLKRSGHSRSGSELTSRGSPSYASPRHLTSLADSLATDSMSWTKLHNISNQIYSESGQLEYGQPSALLVTNTICVGTTKGATLVFDYQQNIKKALVYISSPVTCLAVSSDATFLAVGHESGHVITWDLNSLKHDLVIAPETKSAVLSIAFVGKRHSCVVSGNAAGKAFLHDGYTGITGRKTRTGCIMGQANSSSKPTTIFACSSLPLGSVSSVTDELGLVAIMTPHILAIVSTTPTVMTQFKIGRPKNTNPTLGFIGTLAWYPAVRSSTSVVGSDKPILAYSWANVVTVLEIQPGTSSGFGKKLKFVSIARSTTAESIVGIHWINRQVLGLVTATQSLLVMSFSNGELKLSATVDLLSKHILKFDRYSSTLGELRISTGGKAEDDDDNTVPVVPLDSYSSTVCTFKGRIFLLGCYELVVGYTLSWYDKVEILVKQEQYLNAVKLALAYYDSVSDGVVVGLPMDDTLRRAVVKPAILEVIQMVLPRALRAETSLDLAELTSICVDALINLGDQSIDSTIYDMYEDSDHLALYLDTIATAVFDLRLRSVSPRVFKGLISTYSVSDETTDKMEEIICTLDPATLDVDTTLGLCKKYGLLDASIYIWNVALNDYISPLSEFFQAIVGHDDAQIANRVYSYLSYIFSGRIYPTGLKMATSQTEIEAKSSLYYVLLIGNYISWPKIGGRKIPSLVSTDHYPYLKSLITFNPASFYVALDEAFEDHFLNDNVEHASESHIDEHFFQTGGASLNGATSAQFSEEVSFGRGINRQMIVDVLLQIAPELSPECHVYTLIFIARNYPKYSQFIMLGEGILKSILEHLCVGGPRELRQECELAAEVLISKFRPFDLQWTINLLAEAGYNGALSYIYRTERLFPKLVDHCFSTELYDDIFDVVEKSFEETSGSSTKSAKDRSKIEESVRSNFSQLIRLSPSRTVSLVSEWCPRLHTVVLEGIEEDQQLLYLKSYFHSLRVSGVESPQAAFWTLYISLLARSKENMLEVLETEVASLDFDDSVIENVSPVLQSTDNIESLVVLLQKKKRNDEALNHLLSEINSGNRLDLVEIGAKVCDKDETLWNKFLSGLKSDDAIAEGFKQLSTDLVSYRLVHKILLHQKNTSARVVKSVVLGVTDNYKFKIRFLQLTKEILDANTYAMMMKDLEKQRLRGWKVGAANCDACGKPIYGKGVNGVTLYKAWQQAKTRSREGTKMVFKNKGKENCDGERIDGQLTDRVVVFKCGHVFHLGCMTRLGMVDEIGCLICDAKVEDY